MQINGRAAGAYRRVRYTPGHEIIGPLTVIAAIALVPSSFAQRNPMGITARSMLLVTPDVKKEIRVTKEQDKKLQEAIKQMTQDMQAGKVAMDFTNPLAPMDSKLPEIFDEQQLKRLEELFLQVNLGLALTDAKVATALALSDEQKASTKEMYSQATRTIAETMQTGGMTSRYKNAQKKRDEYAEKMLTILKPEQKEKFEMMKGKAFKFKG